MSHNGVDDMIEITIDHNSDKVIIFDTKERKGIEFDINGSTTKFKNFIYELLNILCADIPKGYEGVRLDEIDEDNRRTVDEW